MQSPILSRFVERNSVPALSWRTWLPPLAAMLTLMTAATHTRAATLAEIEARGYLLVVTEDDFRPFEFVEDGEPAGFDNDMIGRLREYADFEIRQEIIPWTGILPGVTTGKYDIAITAALITPERAGVLGFTSPIADATHYYVKRADDDSIGTIADLDGKRIGVQAGSALLARLPELQAMLDESGGTLGEITEYTSYPEAYQDLAQGRTDIVVNTVINLQALATSRPDVFALGQAVSGASYPGWAVKKGNDELLDYMDAFIAEMKADGTMPALQEKWFGRAFDLPVDYTPDF